MSSICLYTEKKKKEEKVCGTIKHGLTEKLTQQETKTAPTSSQLQTPADLKHRQLHYCMLFCMGLPLLAGVCLPSDSKVPRVWKRPGCSVVSCQGLSAFNYALVPGMEEVWWVETEGGVRNTKPLGGGMSGRGGSSHFQCAFSRKKRKVDLTRPISTREATTTAMWGIRWWCGSTYPSAFAHTCWQQSVD